MKIREPILKGTWYPDDKQGVCTFMTEVSDTLNLPVEGGTARAVIAPHAGWQYSGAIAATAILNLAPAETVVVIGGHLPAGSRFLFPKEDAFRTPIGIARFDTEFTAALKRSLPSAIDENKDNTVEVLMPMVHAQFSFPNVRFVCVRFPADYSSFEAGKLLARISTRLRRTIVVVGSTDLTHYGANYLFWPHGKGLDALDWVRNTNDASLIDAILDGDPKAVLQRAEDDSSACSPGAVLGVLGYVAESGLGRAKLLQYGTSADLDTDTVPDSFVGYAAIAWSPADK